ncbi:MAG: hypothetical protein ABFD12_14465 [Syntrophorhabdus sp.]
MRTIKTGGNREGGGFFMPIHGAQAFLNAQATPVADTSGACVPLSISDLGGFDPEPRFKMHALSHFMGQFRVISS